MAFDEKTVFSSTAPPITANKLKPVINDRDDNYTIEFLFSGREERGNRLDVRTVVSRGQPTSSSLPVEGRRKWAGPARLGRSSLKWHSLSEINLLYVFQLFYHGTA